MLLTEEEARKKTCPQSLTIVNGEGEVLECLASECMAWRWFNQHGLPENMQNDERKGYCGLAGKTE